MLISRNSGPKAEVYAVERDDNRLSKPIERVQNYVADQRERVKVFTEEEFSREREVAEILRILNQAYVPWEQISNIKRVYDKLSRSGKDGFAGSMGVYELGRIHGIRAERKRRKGDQLHNRSIAFCTYQISKRFEI